jgi:DNA-binding LytR/AlgR family response regulator
VAQLVARAPARAWSKDTLRFDQKSQLSARLVQQAAKKKAAVSRARNETGTAATAAREVIGALQQLEVLAKRQCPRIAFKEKGRIFFLDLPEIVAVQAEGNYVSLQHYRNPYLLRESLSSIAQKLRPYGFIRIHRSVVVNTSLVEEIEPLPTGEYKLRVRGGGEYMVTRRYKDNLRHLAHLWIGSRASLWLTADRDKRA